MLAATLFSAALAATPLRVEDGFHRDVTARGLTLLDWEGEIANPAIRLNVVLPPETQYPVEVYLHANSSRIHFNRNDLDDRFGIGKRMRLNSKEDAMNVFMSIFPDRDGKDERHDLVVQLFTGARREITRTTVPIRVIDRDVPSPPPGYPILLNYDEDRTGYFKSPDVRRVLRQAADDWEFFLDDQEIDPTPAGSEASGIWGADGFVTERRITNKKAYKGFLIYISGIRHEEMRAGGSPSLIGKPQTSNGRPLPLRRSGAVNFDVRGNWNQLGWFLSRGDEDWWTSGNLRQEPSDLYSIALHEMGHAIAFEATYPRFGEAKRGAGLSSPELLAYLGKAPPIDASDHFPGVVDPVSGYGTFGMEYLGSAKERRWLITKAHLLSLKAVGYRLRRSSIFVPLSLSPVAQPWILRAGRSGEQRIQAKGGVPDYHFWLSEGTLPSGLSLDSFTGTISGTTQETGEREVEISVDDNDPTTPIQAMTVRLRVEN